MESQIWPLYVFIDVKVENVLQNVSPEIKSNIFDDTINKYERTMRSCLGSKCFDEPVNGIDRVGILAPFMSGGEVITDILKSRVSNDKVVILYDSNVPAYGYGKNHGWTRIIRLVRPIESHAASLTKTSPTAYEAQVHYTSDIDQL